MRPSRSRRPATVVGMCLGLALACMRPASAARRLPAVAPPAVQSAAVTVVLKDGQRARLKPVAYDRYFLTADNAKGTRFNIPWAQVAAVEGSGQGGDLALMRGHITAAPAEVTAVIEPRSPAKAFERALWPGVLLHGAGLAYAGSGGTSSSLAGAEVFGLVVGGFGAYLQAYPNGSDTNRIVPRALVASGIVIFAGTWLWDLAFAPGAARSLDASKGLALEPARNGVQLAYRF